MEMHTSVTQQIVDARLVMKGDAERVYAFWDRVRGTHFAPAFQRDFHMDDLNWDLVGNISLVDVTDGGRDYIYRYWGCHHVFIKGVEMTNKLLSDWSYPAAYTAGLKQFAALIAARKPLANIYDGPYLPDDSLPQVTFRFPLSSDGINVTGILSFQDLDRSPDCWQSLFQAFQHSPQAFTDRCPTSDIF